VKKGGCTCYKFAEYAAKYSFISAVERSGKKIQFVICRIIKYLAVTASQLQGFGNATVRNPRAETWRVNCIQNKLGASIRTYYNVF